MKSKPKAVCCRASVGECILEIIVEGHWGSEIFIFNQLFLRLKCLINALGIDFTIRRKVACRSLNRLQVYAKFHSYSTYVVHVLVDYGPFLHFFLVLVDGQLDLLLPITATRRLRAGDQLNSLSVSVTELLIDNHFSGLRALAKAPYTVNICRPKFLCMTLSHHIYGLHTRWLWRVNYWIFPPLFETFARIAMFSSPVGRAPMAAAFFVELYVTTEEMNVSGGQMMDLQGWEKQKNAAIAER